MPIQKERIVENKRLQNVQGQINVKKDTWMRWYAYAKAFHTKVSSKSYAEVLKNGKQIPGAKYDHNPVRQVSKNGHTSTGRIVTKVPLIRTSYSSTLASGQKRKKVGTDSGILPTQDNMVCLRNRFQILECQEPAVSNENLCQDSSLPVAKSSCLAGNKNGNGSKLGQATEQKQVDHFGQSFLGNKNKTGTKLGLNSTEKSWADNELEQKPHCVVHPDTQSAPSNAHTQVLTANHSPRMHADISFRGNKNGNGPKLGSMHHVNGGQVHCPNLLQIENSLKSGYILSDNNNVTKQRKKNIPETIRLEKIYSTDYNRCMYQNKARFGFIPYNDLLVYTGKEVIWGDIPNIIEAHRLIRNSGLPNFLHMRIPVQSQLNISRWKYYLNNYWDRQLVDVTTNYTC